MDNTSDSAIKLLEMLATCNTKFINHAIFLEKQHEVKVVTTRFECRKFGTGTLIEGYVDAELINGKAVCWYLEVKWDASQNWFIDTRILINGTGGQDTAHKFLDRTTDNFQDFLENLMKATEELIAFEGLKLANIDS